VSATAVRWHSHIRPGAFSRAASVLLLRLPAFPNRPSPPNLESNMVAETRMTVAMAGASKSSDSTKAAKRIRRATTSGSQPAKKSALVDDPVAFVDWASPNGLPCVGSLVRQGLLQSWCQSSVSANNFRQTYRCDSTSH